MKKFVEFIECEIINNEMQQRKPCFIHKDKVQYIEECEDYTGYSYVGLDRMTTIVKGTPKQIIKKLEGK